MATKQPWQTEEEKSDEEIPKNAVSQLTDVETAAEKFLVGLLEAHPPTLLVTSSQLRPIPHSIQIFHNTRHGFYILTKDGSLIVRHIERNPFVTLSISSQNEGKLAIAQCTAHINSDRAFINEVWSDEQIQFGNSGSNDPELRVILISIHSIDYEGKTLDGVPLDEQLYSQIQAETDEVNSGPFQTEQAIELLSQLFSIGQPAHLITFS
ncbi:MAG: hypothetical protein EZS28_046069, partial [Streblomastix strix]